MFSVYLSVHTPGVPHLHPIILPLVPCPFQGNPSPPHNTSTGSISFLGVPHLHPLILPPGYPRLSGTGWHLDRLCRGRYAWCGFPQEDYFCCDLLLFLKLMHWWIQDLVKVTSEQVYRFLGGQSGQVLDKLSYAFVSKLCHFFDILFEGIYSWSTQWSRTSQS